MTRSADFLRESRNQDLNAKSPDSPESMPGFERFATNQQKNPKTKKLKKPKKTPLSYISGLELKSHQLAGDLRHALLVGMGFAHEETEVQRDVTYS